MNIETEQHRSGASPRARAGAVLLNATGLGLGYGYLGLRVRAVAAAVVTIGLLVLAFALGPDARPWLWPVLVVVWVVATTGDAWWQAGRPGRRERTADGWRPAAVGLVLLALVATGLAVYTAAARDLYTDGVAAQGRGDCAAATARFGTVGGPYGLALTSDVAAARTGGVECTAYLAARTARDGGNFPEAVARYRDIRRIHPDTALAPVVERDLVAGYTDWAAARRAADDHQGAIDVYREQLTEFPDGPVAERAGEDLAATHVELAVAAREGLRPDQDRLAQVRPAAEALLTVQREFADTAAAAQVPQELAAVVTAADASVPPDTPCDALPVLDYAVGLTGAGTADAVAAAGAARVPRRLDCGISRFGAGDHTAAAAEFERLLAEHPDSPQAAQARSALIAARVAEQHFAPVPLPAPYAGDTTGDNVLTVYNDSPQEILVRLSGPTAHEFTLPPCPECPATYADSADACPTFDGRPSYVLRLAPGTYEKLTTTPGDTSIDPKANSQVIDQGFDYTSCLHVEQGRPFSPYLPYLPEVEPVAPR